MATKYTSKTNTVIKVGDIYTNHDHYGLIEKHTFLILDVYKSLTGRIWRIKVQCLDDGYVYRYVAASFSRSHVNVNAQNTNAT
jgi:aspartate aminotransferase-like enzyme